MQDPGKQYLNNLPFSSDGEYMETLFVVLDLLIFTDPSQRMADRGLDMDQDPDTWITLLRDRLRMSNAVGLKPAMEKILAKLNAPYYMRYLLAYLIKSTLDSSYEAAAAAEYGKRTLMLYDLCELFASPVFREDPAEVYTLLEKGRDCLEFLFPQLRAKEQRSGQSMAALGPLLDSRLLAMLLGKEEFSPLTEGVEIYRPEAEEAETAAADAGPEGSASSDAEKTGTWESAGTRRAADLLLRRKESMEPEIIVLWGPEGSGKRDVVKEYAKRTRRSLAFYEIPKQEEKARILPDLLKTELELFRRECVLSELQPVVCRGERLDQELQQELTAWLQKNLLPVSGNVILLMETEEAPDHLAGCYFLPMDELRGVERNRLWREVLPENTRISSEGIDALANTFRLTQGQIRKAAVQAIRMAGPDAQVTEDILYEVCYAALGHPLKAHTQRVKSPFRWEDLKMEPQDKAILQDIVGCVRSRDIVMQQWNFEKKLPYGTGITAIFTGPPGTGKTMSAQIIANELHMELYKIDLSQLIDKYVGETEKNIKRVFVEAGRSNSVLFFDEADAIFNKRLEAGNSNDRFANIESSLLLQCIEEFSGITLLATNNMNAIDSAFLRRFRFFVQFREPDEEIRYEIWTSVFPKEAPVDPDVDFRELANIFAFTGAVIKNVALQAAYLAAGAGRSIGILEIMVAIRREMEKNHRTLSRDLMGKYGDLFPKVIGWESGS